MRRYLKALLALLATSSALLSQEPAPICGLPHISRISPDTPVSLYKADYVLTGDRTFNIREDVTGIQFIPVSFFLKYSDENFEVYVEVAEWDSGHVDITAVDTLAAYFGDRTPPDSPNPGSGIKAITEEVFGLPPDIDNNEKVYILLIDVRDDYVPGESETYVAGYFDPADQDDSHWGSGNSADIIYLDTNPGVLLGGEILQQIGTLTHEYQHLIHYGRDPDEDTWVNEGLSELSTVIVGLPHREFAYYLTDTNVQLDYFGGGLADYARCGIFFLYTWVQLGTDFIKDLVALPTHGINAFESALDSYGPPFNDHVYNWHLANFLHTEGIYGYGGYDPLPQPVMHDFINSFPGELTDRPVKRLGARWTLITGGQDLDLSATRDGAEPDITLLNGDDRTVIPAPLLFSAGFQDTAFGTAYSDLVVLATSSTAVGDNAFFTLSADAESGFEEIILSYDGDEGPDPVVPYINLGNGETDGEAAVVFDIADDNAELYAVQFYALTSDSVRIRVYQQTLDPDNIIYTAPVWAPLGDQWTTHRLPQGLHEGNQRIYISVASVGNALAYNEHTSTSYSYYRFPGQTSFTPLSSLHVTVDDNKIYLIGNWSIRLTYLVPDSSQLAIDTPPAVVRPTIGSFYPNPFNAVTSLDVSPGHDVELVLYDLLGREVRRLSRQATSDASLFWDGKMNNGRIAPSGLYLARVMVGELVVYRKLALIR